MKVRYLLSLFFVALICMGLFHLAITPIFEGFDEIGHYSAIRQIAYQGKIPLRNESFLDEVVVNYSGPEQYSTGTPPFDGGMVYYKFYNRLDLVDNYLTQYRKNIPPTFYSPSAEPNPEYRQHPALYYALMAPILRLVDGGSLVTQIFVLRLFSYLMALSGVALGMMAIMQRREIGTQVKTIHMLFGFLFYPVLFPMFFPEYARIGNDSLCLLLVGLLAYLLSKWVANSGGVRVSLAIGLTLALGLLTKAFFVLISAVFFMFIFMYLFVWRRNEQHTTRGALISASVILPALGIGGSWYVYNYLTVGNFSGSIVASYVANRGGLLVNFANTFSFPVFLRGVAASPVTFIWGGTGSLAHLPHTLYVPLILVTAWICWAFWLRLRKIQLWDTLWLAVWLVFAFAIGISWHALANMTWGGSGNTPGWYLHILLPFVAPAIGVAVGAIVSDLRLRSVFICVIAYSVIFFLIAIWSQLALFSGCAIKGSDKQYVFQSDLWCFDNIFQIIDRLHVSGFPMVGVIAFGGWAACSSLLAFALSKQILRKSI